MISKINISTITDNDFDILYPEQIKNLSSIHWSPAAAIKTAVDFRGTPAGTFIFELDPDQTPEAERLRHLIP